MALEPGSRLGSYEILAPLGGGTSDVYKATDTRRNRVVALKVLPPEFSERPDMKDRLERDSRTISSLNHPNICSLVDVGHHDPATDFIVSEYVEGETLAARLAKGPLELQDALPIGIAIADSLDKAHRKGIVHGGLTPSVVMLTANGPKLLDFGLAKAQEESQLAGAATLATTRTSVASLSTVPAVAAPYLAPEQFAGGAADARSDIFAFGAILYEMVTGRPAFQEQTLALLIAAVQTVDPEPASKVEPMVPAALDHVIRRCLQKDPKQRLQTAWDLLVQLQWVAEGGTQVGLPVPVAARRQRQDRAVYAGLAVASVMALGLTPTVLSRFGARPEPRSARFVVTSVGAVPGVPITISPDGRWIVGSKGGGLANAGIDGITLNSVTSQVLAREELVIQPFWSPDSRSFAYIDGMQRLRKADVSGGPSQTISEVPLPFAGGTWNRDGVILFSGAGLIQRVLAAGGQPTPITELDASRQESEHMAPDFLPDGRRYIFLAVSSQAGESAIFVGSLDSKERTRLFPSDSRAVYAAPGYLLFNRGNAVFAQAFDADSLTLSGEAIRVADGVPLYGAGTPGAPAGAASSLTRNAIFAVSQTGVLIHRSGANSTEQAAAAGDQRAIVWIDRSGARVGQLGSPGTYAGLDLSPDGKRFAVHRHEGLGGDNWSFDLTQGRMQRLTFDTTQDNSSPLWSPDGKQIVFASRRDNKWGLYVKSADGTGSEELIVESDAPKAPNSWSPDGQLIVFMQFVGANSDVWAVAVTGDRKPIPLLQSEFNEAFGQVSPDGKWLAYQSNETGRAEIYLKPFPEGPGKWQVSTDGGQFPRWGRAGRELYFAQQPNLWMVEIRVTGSAPEAGVPQALFALGGNPSTALNLHAPYNRFAVTADGQRFLMSQPGGAANVVTGVAETIASIADVGAAASPAGGAITVVLNWPRMVEASQ
ncbi:MAG TPA: protein kinase [Vicinamibacterales bacterium]|nr:protein kinase [Vicinamibacterales bacterium]